MPIMPKKGQASLEYLLTYGWAILIIAAVIAIIIGSGIFSPKNSAANYAVSPPQLPVNGFLMTGTDGNTVFKINLSNNFGYKIQITGITLNYRDGTYTYSPSPPNRLTQGQSIVYSFDLNNIKTKSGSPTYPSRGTTGKIDVRLDYTNCYEPINANCDKTTADGTDTTSTIPIYIVGYVESSD
jgi:hypothetical protein